MKTKATLLGLCAVLAAGAAQAQAPIDMKPGLWELRVLKMEQDGKDMVAQMRQAMASVPPDQRKKMGMSDDGITSRICFSAAMTKGGDWLPGQNLEKQARAQGCTPPKINHSGNRTTFEATCKEASSKGEYVVAGDQITMKSEMAITTGGNKHTLVQESQMQFIGGNCGDLKPLDQIAKEMQAAAAAGQPQGKPAKK